VVFIIVAVQKGLDEIKAALKDRGYETVDAETYNYPIDAVVYEGSSFQLSLITGNNMPAVSSGPRANYGVLMINSRGKTVDWIEYVLRNRCYSRLLC